MMTALTSASRSASRNAPVRSASSCSLNALRTFGRFRVSVATRLARSTSRTASGAESAAELAAMIDRPPLLEKRGYPFPRVFGFKNGGHALPLVLQPLGERRIERLQHGGLRQP